VRYWVAANAAYFSADAAYDAARAAFWVDADAADAGMAEYFADQAVVWAVRADPDLDLLSLEQKALTY